MPEAQSHIRRAGNQRPAPGVACNRARIALQKASKSPRRLRTTSTTIEAGYAPGATALSIPITAPTNGAVFPGVPSGTYFVRTRAFNGCGQSTASVERTIVVQ